MSLPDWKIISECMDKFRDSDIDEYYIVQEYQVSWQVARYLTAKIKDELRAEAMNYEF